LRDILPASQMEEVREREQYEKLRNLLTEYQLIVDSTEQPTARPVDYEEQKKYYSGEKDAHFKKSVYCFTTRSRHCWRSGRRAGQKSDINLFRATQNKFDALQTFLGDKAYKGELAIITPDKKRKIVNWQIYRSKQIKNYLHCA